MAVAASPASATPRTARRQRAVTLSLLFAAGAVNFFDRASLAVANNPVRAEMHLSGTQIGWLLSVFSLAYGASQLPLIAVLPRVGARRVFGAGLGLWSTAQLLTGTVRSMPPFLALRVLLGIGESPFFPAGVHIIQAWFGPESRGRATALLNSSQAVALAIAPPVLTLLILRIGWRATFMLLGVAGLCVSALWFLLYRARDEPGGEPGAESHPAGADAGPQIGVWKRLLRRRTTWGMMLGFSGVSYSNWLYTAWVPGYLQTARHLSFARTGWVASIPFFFGALGMLLNGVLADGLARRGLRLTTVHRTNLIAGMVLSAASTLAVAHASTATVAVSGISLALFFVHFAGTSGWGYAQAVAAPGFVASLSAMQNFGASLMASAAPVLTGWLLDRTHSFTLALTVCSAVALLGALSYATLAAPGETPVGAA